MTDRIEDATARLRGRLRARPGGEAGGVAFDGFVSYSHAADGRLAPALQRAMQRLAKPWYRPRALRVFRDEAALSANPHLWSSIQTALDDSAWFVLLASPDAAASEWVGRELDHWLANKSADRILVVVTDGTWQWDPTTRALTGTAVPSALRTAFEDEPRHVDLRWAATETDLDMHHARFRDVVAQLAAPLHGIGKDDLDSEDVRQHRRARRLARGGVTVLTLLVVISLVTTAFAFVQRSHANRNADVARHQTQVARHQAQVATAERLAAVAVSHRNIDQSQALLLATEGYRRADSVTTRAALLGTLTRTPQLVGFMPGARDTVTSVISPDGRLVAGGTDDGSVRFWNPRDPADTTASVEPTAAGRGVPVVDMTFDREGRTLFVLFRDGRVETWNAAERSRVGAPMSTAARNIASISVSPNGRTVVVDGSLVYNASDHRLLANLGVGFYSAFSADGETLFSSGVNGLIAYDTRTWRQIGPPVLPLDRNLGRIGEVAAATEQQSVGREHLVVTSIGATRGLGATVFNADERRAGIEIGTTLNVNVVALSKDGHSLVLGGLDGTIEIWPSSGGSLDGAVSAPLRQGGKIESVSLADDSRTLVSTSEDGSTVVWDLLGQGAMSRGHMLRGVVGFNALVAASPVGSNVVVSVNATSAVDVASRPNATSVVDVASRPPRVVRDLGRQAAPCAIDPTGTKVLFSGRSSVTGEPENTITNVDGGQPQTVLRGETVVCAANGGPYVIAAAGDPFVGGQPFVVTDVWRGRKLGSFSLDPSLAAQSLVAVVDGQGRRVAIVDGAGAVVVRDARSGRPDGKPIVATAPTTALAFSSGGDELAIGRHDGTVQRYAVPSLRKIGAPLGGHTLAIRAIAYQPGGLLLASASYDAVDIVDRATNERVATIPYAGGDPLLVDRFTTPGKGTVQFAHGGRILLTNGYSPAGATRAVPALLWPMAPSEWIAAACQAAGRNLTRDEWSQNVGTGVPYHRTCPQWPTGA